MGTGPRNYSDKTLKRLFGLSGNKCAFPGCNRRLVNQDNAKDSNICHIEAANIGGERYNQNMTDEQRADYDNLILLCVQHHDETNDVATYSVEEMKRLKRNHESQFLNETLKANPSMLINAIQAISEIDLSSYPETATLHIVDPREKIQYNSLKRNAILIEEYKVFHTKINTLYDELEYQGSLKKEKLLKNIKLMYDQAKGRYVKDALEPIVIIRQHSDDIFDAVLDAMEQRLGDSGLWQEDIFLGIRIIAIDAFIRCKILEEPA